MGVHAAGPLCWTEPPRRVMFLLCFLIGPLFVGGGGSQFDLGALMKASYMNAKNTVHCLLTDHSLTFEIPLDFPLGRIR